MGLIKRRYPLYNFLATQVYNLVHNVIGRCDVCSTCKPCTNQHADTRHVYPIPPYPFVLVAMDVVQLPSY